MKKKNAIIISSVVLVLAICAVGVIIGYKSKGNFNSEKKEKQSEEQLLEGSNQSKEPALNLEIDAEYEVEEKNSQTSENKESSSKDDKDSPIDTTEENITGNQTKPAKEPTTEKTTEDSTDPAKPSEGVIVLPEVDF